MLCELKKQYVDIFYEILYTSPWRARVRCPNVRHHGVLECAAPTWRECANAFPAATTTRAAATTGATATTACASAKAESQLVITLVSIPGDHCLGIQASSPEYYHRGITTCGQHHHGIIAQISPCVITRASSPESITWAVSPRHHRPRFVTLASSPWHHPKKRFDCKQTPNQRVSLKPSIMDFRWFCVNPNVSRPAGMTKALV